MHTAGGPRLDEGPQGLSQHGGRPLMPPERRPGGGSTTRLSAGERRGALGSPVAQATPLWHVTAPSTPPVLVHIGGGGRPSTTRLCSARGGTGNRRWLRDYPDTEV